MAYSVELSEFALGEIGEIVDYIASDSRHSARGWLERLRAAIDGLSEMPRRCPLAPESEAWGYEVRHLLFGSPRPNYRVIFEIRDDDLVFVLSVRHGARGEMRG